MDPLRLILVDPNPSLCVEWEDRFADLPNTQVVCSPFERLEAFDCLVSPANSFGLMDGGVDGAILRFFGRDLQRRVQQRILEEYLGEQPVGTSMIMETGHPLHPFLAHTPTMRIPVPISRTDHVYTAMWAMLLAARRHNLSAEQEKQIKSVACPGLGTGTGRMHPGEAARQMALAYRHFLSPPDRITWTFASSRQDAVRVGGDLGLLVVKSTPTVP